jgi:hypothetical protein
VVEDVYEQLVDEFDMVGLESIQQDIERSPQRESGQGWKKFKEFIRTFRHDFI